MKRLSLFKKPMQLLMAIMAFAVVCSSVATAQYCQPYYYDNAPYMWITGVTIGSVSNTGTYVDVDNYCYTDYSPSITFSAAPGVATDFTVEFNNVYDMGLSIWVDLDHNGSFDYDAEQVYVDYNYNPDGFSGSFTIPADAITGETRIRFASSYYDAPYDPCGGYSYGEAEDYTINIESPIERDAALLAITQPVIPFTSGSKSIIVTLKNLGTETLTSTTINWSANGISQSAYSWTGSLAKGQETSVTLGSFNFQPKTKYTIIATTSGVNGNTDENTANNSVTVDRAAVLSNGSYTVGGTSPDFATPVLAAQYLAVSAATGTGGIVFNVRPGTYNGQLALTGNITGTNTTANPLTFQSENGNPAEVILQYTATTPTADNYVVQLDGANNVTIKNMTLSNTGASYGTVVYILNGADNAVITGNVLNGRNAASSAFEDAVVRTPQGGTANNNNLTVSNNRINYGSLGFYAFSPYTPLTTGLRIDGNTFQGAYAGPILMDYMNSPVIVNNILLGSTNGRLTGYGIRVRTTDGSTLIERNKLSGFIGGRGIVIEGSYTSGDPGRSRIANNFIEVGANTANDADGINVLRNNVDVFNNTVNATGTGSTSDALDIGSFTSVDVRNNILIAKNGRAINAVNDFGTAAYNDLYTSGPVLVSYIGTNYTTLAQWQTTGKGANSKSLLPVFTSQTDLHLSTVNTQLFGLAGITNTDIDNETRRNYYIGADEVIPTITITTQPVTSSSGCFGSNSVLSVASTSTFGSVRSYQWQRNGSPIFDNDRFMGTTTPTLTITSTQPADAGVYSVRITDNSGATPVISTTSNLIVNAPIEIASQPQSKVICPGAEAALSVIANGTVNGIQWQKENPNSPTGYSNIAGATTPQIFLANANYSTSGKYRVLLFGTCGTDTVISQIAVVFVGTPTYVARQVENEITIIGGTAALSVEAEVSGSPTQGASYTWYRNGIALTDDGRINGSKSSILTINKIQSSDTAATYYAQVTGICGTAQSNLAKIYIAGITIAQAPQATSVCSGSTATLTVAATSSIAGSTMTYQWIKDGVALQNVGNISGAKTATLTITNAAAADESANYTVKVTSQPGNVTITSVPVGLTLKLPATITTAPTAQDICEGSTLNLSVSATGTGLTYEWRKDGIPVSGATGSTYTVPTATMAMAGEYTVVIHGECTSIEAGITSDPVAVTIKAATAITTQPVAVSQNQFNTLTLSVTASGSGAMSYQWYHNGTAIAGATAATYTKANSSPADDGTYYVEVTGDCGMVKSNEIAVLITTDIADIPVSGYSVDATSPSPVYESGSISFTLGKAEVATITITDIFGREVAVMSTKYPTQGHQSVAFSTSDMKLTSGVYMYTVQTPTFRATRQMVVVK